MLSPWCSPVLGPPGSPALIHKIFPGNALVRTQVVSNQSGAAPEQNTFIAAFIGPISPPRRRRRIGKTAGFPGRRIKNSVIRRIDRRPPLNQNDSGGADQTSSLQKSDLAFQHAMLCAIARGLEHPPRIGVVKDSRPLSAPRLFEPVPHSSGCTSPALECAELAAQNE
jgi:hypothetical protein